MSRSIIIGDVHGCYHTLMSLLDSLSYQSSDQLFFTGDLVGKGQYSDLVLDFCFSNQVGLVLGNHELSLLRYYFMGVDKVRPDFKTVLDHSKAKEWVDFLIHQPFMMIQDFGVLVHAAVDYSWTIDDLQLINQNLCQDLQRSPKQFFIDMVVPGQRIWSESMTRLEQRFFAVEALTRMRYYNAKGQMDDQDITGPPEENKHLTPWYMMPRKIKQPVFFGHWASLKGQDIDNAFHLDGGCVYGGQLLAQEGQTKQRWRQRVERQDQDQTTGS